MRKEFEIGDRVTFGGMVRASGEKGTVVDILPWDGDKDTATVEVEWDDGDVSRERSHSLTPIKEE